MNLVTPCFTAVNGSGKIKLSELSITGYKDASGNYIKGWGINNGITKAAVISVINNNGGVQTKTIDEIKYNVEYFWTDTKTKPAGWYDANGNPMTKDGGSLWGDAANIKFTNGNGFRIKFNEFYSDDDPDEEEDPLALDIVFSGQVIKGDAEITYIPGMIKAAGNLMPTELKLSEMSIGGYTDKDGNYIKGWGINNGITKAGSISVINGNGGVQTKTIEEVKYNVEYFWTDTKTKAAGWYDANGNPMTDDGGSLWGDAALIKFGPADGFRVKLNEFYSDDDPDEEEDPLAMNIKLPGCL